MTLTKIGGRVEVADIGKDKTHDGVQQAIRILDERSERSAPIQADARSLLSVLANFGVRPLRLYALLDESERAHLDEMKKAVLDIVDGE